MQTCKDTDWVTLLGGNDRRGGTTAARRTGPAELIWKVALTDGIRSSPVLADGVLYVTSRDGSAYAFDARTGRERWTFAAGGLGAFDPGDLRRPRALRM